MPLLVLLLRMEWRLYLRIEMLLLLLTESISVSVTEPGCFGYLIAVVHTFHLFLFFCALFCLDAILFFFEIPAYSYHWTLCTINVDCYLMGTGHLSWESGLPCS